MFFRTTDNTVLFYYWSEQNVSVYSTCKSQNTIKCLFLKNKSVHTWWCGISSGSFWYDILHNYACAVSKPIFEKTNL